MHCAHITMYRYTDSEHWVLFLACAGGGCEHRTRVVHARSWFCHTLQEAVSKELDHLLEEQTQMDIRMAAFQQMLYVHIFEQTLPVDTISIPPLSLSSLSPLPLPSSVLSYLFPSGPTWRLSMGTHRNSAALSQERVNWQSPLAVKFVY